MYCQCQQWKQEQKQQAQQEKKESAERRKFDASKIQTALKDMLPDGTTRSNKQNVSAQAALLLKVFLILFAVFSIFVGSARWFGSPCGKWRWLKLKLDVPKFWSKTNFVFRSIIKQRNHVKCEAMLDRNFVEQKQSTHFRFDSQQVIIEKMVILPLE